MKRKASASPPTTSATASEWLPSHRLDALLRSIRCIRQHEDALCGLLHELRGERQLTREQATDLAGILSDLPAHDYLDDVQLVSELIGQPLLPVRRSTIGLRARNVRKKPTKKMTAKPKKRSVIQKVASPTKAKNHKSR